MPYLFCPRCRLGYGGREAMALESCPRCLARSGERVRLEARLGTEERDGRMVAAARTELGSRPKRAGRSAAAEG